jgi:16S rRNA (guanine966-N2)-methyltransferase
VTRIIAGAAGGRTLRTPPGAGTRPTSDRVREALFSALEARDAVAGARVLDLYAGSGALGLEALSRGAVSAVFVEADRRAASVVRSNAAALGFADRCTVVVAPVRSVLGRSVPGHPAPGRGEASADLVFMDPPYDLAEADLAEDLRMVADPSWLAPGGLLVVERSSRSPEPSWPEGLAAVKPRRYGETTIWLASRTG